MQCRKERREGTDQTSRVGSEPVLASLTQCSDARVWNNGGAETLWVLF
jgi:hypothetical protein